MKSIWIAMMLLLVVAAGHNLTDRQELVVGTLHAAEASSIDRVRLELKKLREAMASMQDLDELEKAGMPKRDVDRMRRAMQLKITEMMNEAMASIRAL